MPNKERVNGTFILFLLFYNREVTIDVIRIHPLTKSAVSYGTMRPTIFRHAKPVKIVIANMIGKMHLF